MEDKMIYRTEHILLFLAIALLFLSCKKTEDDSNRVPAPLSNVTVTNINKGAEIFYDFPRDEDIILVTVQYNTDTGGIEIVRFDIEKHPNSLVLDNLPEGKRVVELYTVNSIGNNSSRVEVEVDPLISAERLYLDKIVNSIELTPAVNERIFIDFENNSDNKTIYFEISYRDEETNNWIPYDQEITSSDEQGRLTVSRLAYSNFKLFLRDETSETSLVRDFNVTPIVEHELDKANWVNPKFENDNWRHISSLVIERLWDNRIDARFESQKRELPFAFSIDLGENQDLKLTRIKIHHFHHATDYTYMRKHPREIEIWASNDPNPDLNGNTDWVNWTKLTEYHSHKPSGAEYNDVTQMDRDYVRAGEDIIIPDDKIATYRFIRFNIIELWYNEQVPGFPSSGITPNGATHNTATMVEVTVWGIE